MVALNKIIHQPIRLRIMAALVALQPDDQMEFTYLRSLLNLTDGNLGAHLRKLEQADYVKLRKTFVSRKPRTYISTTVKGRKAFDDHVLALENILQSTKSDPL
jgi:DNA-binding MarR family transcriptional regulator